jgi:hypothetical protein
MNIVNRPLQADFAREEQGSDIRSGTPVADKSVLIEPVVSLLGIALPILAPMFLVVLAMALSLQGEAVRYVENRDRLFKEANERDPFNMKNILK